MKQFTIFNQLTAMPKRLAMVLTVLFTLSVGNMWADYTIHFKSTTGEDGTSAQTTIANLISSGSDKVSSISADKAYNGKSGFGVKLGSSSVAGYVTMTLATTAQINASKLVVSAAYFDSGKTLKVTVTYTDNTTTTKTLTPASTVTEYDVNLEAAKIIKSIKVESVTASKGRMYCASVKVVAAAAAPSYTITAKSNNETYGTVSLSGTTITASPKTGYTYADPACTVTSGTATVSQRGNTFTVTPTSNCTIRINFEALPKYKVTFDAGSGSCSTSSLTEASAGVGVTLPEPSICDGWEFAGWATSSVSTETTTAPTLLTAGSSYKPSADCTLYAVYSRTETTSGGASSVSESITIIPNTFTDKGSNNYGSGTERTGTVDGISFGGHYITGNAKNTPANATAGTYLQCRANDATIYNKTELPGNITKVVINQYDAKAFSLYCGSEQLIASNNTTEAQTPSGTKISDVTAATQMTWNISGDYTYFALKKGATAGYVTSIVVTYTTSGGSPSTTYYHSTPECTTQATITLNPNGGTISESGWKLSESKYTQTVETTDDVSFPTPSKDGYTFAGWYEKEDFTGSAVTKIVSGSTGNKEFWAKWTANTYAVALDNQGATTAGATSVTATYNSAMPSIASNLPKKTGYTFNGYFTETNGSGTKYYNADGTSAKNWDKTSEATLYAQWECVTPTISTQPQSATYIQEDDATDLSVAATAADATLTYQWQSSSDNSNWSDITGATEATYKPSTQSVGTTYYQVVVTNSEGNCSAISDVATITVRSANCKWVETEIGDIESGDEVVVVMAHGENLYALPYDSEKASNSNPIATPITLDDFAGTISGTLIWYIKKGNEGNITLSPKTATDKYLTCNKSSNAVRINTGENRNFTIENDFLKNTAFSTYLAISTTADIPDWRHYEATNTTISNKGQTLKFYKKECLDSETFWVDYNLANVTCNSEMPNYIGTDGEIELYFSANSGYKLPEQVSITMGGLPLSEDAFAWESEEGLLYIIPDGGITGNLVITIEGCELLALPTNLKATNITSSSARLTWDEIEHAEQYQVHVTDDDDSTEDIITTTSNIYLEITGLNSASEYLWGVTPIASGYCGIKQEAEIFETLNVYTVSFITSLGNTPSTQTVDARSKATEPEKLSADGYTFDYWYTTDANVSFDFNTPITGNTTLNAKWTPRVYTITFYKQNGTGGTDNATVTFNSNDYSVATIEAPTRDKYEFSGYYTEQHGAGIQVVDADGKWVKNVAGYTDANGNWIKAADTHLYAKWTAIHTITWVVNNNTETPYHTSTVLSGSTINQLPTAPADDLFEDCDVNAFVGWSTDNIGLTPDAIAPTDLFKTVADAQSKIGAIEADKKFYAVYASTSNSTVTFDAADVSELTKNNLTWTHSETGISLALSAGQHYTNNTPYTFTVTNGTSNYCQIIAPAAKSVTKVVVELSGSSYKVNSVSSGWSLSTSSTTQTITGSGTDLKMYATSSNQIRIKTAEVTYTTYTNFITRCTALPDPVWGGATIDNAVIPVNCGSTTSNSHAAQISFPTASNYNLYKDITIEVNSGNFIIASSRDGEYTTSVTLSPTQSGDNAGTFANKYVYVRAVAPAQSDEDFTGTITISGKQIANQTINVTADVTCTQYAITFNDQGQTKEVQGFAGTSVMAPEPWVGICTEPIQYVFDGWAETPVANDTEEYEKIDFSAYTMPDNNTTVLHAVYRYAEEGGEPVNGYVKVTEALSDWTGDYVIVNETAKKAIGNAYKTNTNNDKTLIATDVTITDNKIDNPTANIIWQIRKNGENYTMYNESASKYAYITGSKSENAGLSDAVQYINISWGSSPETARVIGGGDYSGRCFSYYTNEVEWRTYAASSNNVTGALYKLSNKSLLYTSSLICGEISVEDDNVVVTSTKDQTVKVYVPITLEYSDVASITGTSDNEAFTVVTKNDVAVGESNIEVHYKPTAYVNTANQEETATITLTTSNGATTSFNITGRCLPENFVIAAKWGENWYALPANMSSTDSKDGMLIDVDDSSDPIKAKAAPSSAQYSLKSVKPGKFANQGERLVFVGNEGKTLYNAEGTSIQVFAQYENYDDDRYEWVPTTTDLKDYILTSAYTFSGDAAARTISLDKHGVFGTLLQDKSYNGMVRLLPVDEFYTPTELQVVEWKANSVSIMYTGAGTKATTKVGNNAETAVQLLSNKKIDHAVYTLATSDLTTATNQVLTISIKDDAENTIGTLKMTVPAIVSSDVTSTSLVTSTEIAQATDIVVLDGATLTAATTKYTFHDIVVYPGAKLEIGSSGKLGMYSLTLRLGSSWGAAEYEHKYPEFVLNTTTSQAYSNTSGKINLDYVTTKSQYYTFVAPFAVNTKDIKYPIDIYGSNVEANNRGSFEFQYYDGAARANGEKGWKVVEEDPTNGATLTAHQGYTFYGMPKKVSVNGGTSTRQTYGIHRIPMSIGATKVMEHENSEQQTTKVSAYLSEHNINAGWNLIGNPYMATITGLDNQSIQTGTIVLVDNKWQWSNAGSQANRFIVFPSNDGEWYYTSQASNATLPAFKNFFVQIGDKDATALSIPRNTPAAQLLAPARQAEEIERDIELAIVLEKDEAHSDQMDFLLNDTYGAGFDYNADFTKMMNNTQLNLYGVHWDDKLSFVAIDHFTARAAVEIGYQVPSAGEYTLRISDKPYVMLDKIEAIYVTDHEMTPAITTNLMEEDYVFQVGKAEINDTRFTISFGAPTNNNGGDVTTDMGEVEVNSEQPQKFFYDGKLYILRDGKLYSATGHEIKTINK